MQISDIRMLIELKELGEKDATAIPSILESKERIQTGHMADSEGGIWKGWFLNQLLVFKLLYDRLSGF